MEFKIDDITLIKCLIPFYLSRGCGNKTFDEIQDISSELGLKYVRYSMGNYTYTFDIIDEHKYFLAKIKYGI